ncbi:GTPase IMAP family member 4-like [Anguilla rostrata]|uniref:GTPase IMAP family member 4-like n=1 Tax=Anguilla rostrata TaxID=7938 RepID=UPI0030CB40D4
MASCKLSMDPENGFLTSDEEEEESACCKAQSQSALRIVLMGVRWAGKSSAGNIILGREEFDSKVGTVRCVRRQGETAGRQLVVVDTSGWVWHSAQDTAARVEQEIASSVSLCHPGPHAILLVIPTGSPGKGYKQAVRKHLELLSERVCNHTIVLFTQGDTTDQHIEKGGKSLQLLLEKY